MERDGTVRVYVGVSSHGQGHATTFAQLVADRLGIDPSQVEIIHSDTDVTPYSAYGTAASRSIAVGGGATVRAAEQLASRLVSLAALLLETDPTNVMFLDGDAVLRDDPSRRLPLAAVADPYVANGPYGVIRGGGWDSDSPFCRSAFRNWWFPSWLDRLIPKLNVEGHRPHEELVGSVVVGD